MSRPAYEPGKSDWKTSFDTLAEVGYAGWLVIEAFGQALPALVAATKIWRRMYDSEEQLARDGLAFERCDVAACLNVATDHLGEHGIETVADMAKHKRQIIERSGVLEATYERNPPHFHVALFPSQYAAYVERKLASGADETDGRRERIQRLLQPGQPILRLHYGAYFTGLLLHDRCFHDSLNGASEPAGVKGASMQHFRGNSRALEYSSPQRLI